MQFSNPNLFPQYQNPLFQPVRTPRQQPLVPVEEESLLKQMGSTVLSGLSAVGNFFDLPGSSARDLLTGQNPLDQWTTPFSHENRATGRDVLANYGLATPNDPDRWEVMDVVGGLAEIPMDPFFWMPAGSIARGTGAVKNAIPQTIRTAVAQSPVGQVAENARLLKNQLFDASVKGRATAQGQKSAQKLHADQLKSDQSVLGELLPAARDLADLEIEIPSAAGGVDVVRGYERSQLHRDYLEGIEGAAAKLDPREMEILDRVQGYKEATRERLVKLGRDSGELDDEINHVFRRMGKDVEGMFEKVKGNEPRSPLTSFNPGDTSRQEQFKGFQGGTNQVNEVYADPELDGMIRQMAESGAKKKQIEQAVRDRLAEKYADDIIPEYQAISEKTGLPLYRVKVSQVDTKGDLHDVWKTIGISKEQMEKYTTPIEVGEDAGKLLYRSTFKAGGKTKERVMIIDAPVMKDRLQEIAKTMVKTPEFRVNGIFTNKLLDDAHDGLRGLNYQADAIDATYDLLSSEGVLLDRMAPQVNLNAGERAVKLVDLLKELRVNMDTAMSDIARRKYKLDDLDKDTLKALRKMEVNKDVADDLRALWQGFRAPAEIGPIVQGVQSLTSLFKAGVLTWPSRYMRDVISGMVRNWEKGTFDLQSGMQAYRILQGQTVDGLEKIPEITEWLQRTGREITPENATKAFSEIYAAKKASPVFMHTDVPSGAAPRDALLDQIPGRKPALSLGELGSTFFGRTPGTNLNPMNVRGNSFLNRAEPGQVRADTSFGPAAAGDILGKFTDDLNRMVPLLNQMKKGIRSDKAMDLIQEMQVDYSPRSFTKFEQGLKQLLPFYSFSSRQIPYVTKELLNNPAGRLGQIIQATRRGRGEDDGSLPDYVSGTTAIPIGERPDGTKSFITGLGLMHEDPLSFLTFNKDSWAPNITDSLVEMGSRLNPVYKAPLELMAGESFFQRGPMGGRDLLDMDPTMGRLASNISQMVTGNPIEDAAGRAIPIGGTLTEHLVANSPLSRLMSTARTITDPRKYEGDFPGLGVATNLLTGARVSDISPASQEAVERERIQAFGREQLGAKSYVATYIPKEVIEETKKTNPEEARKYEAFNRVRQVFKKRREKREAAQEQEQATTGGNNRLKRALLSR